MRVHFLTASGPTGFDERWLASDMASAPPEALMICRMFRAISMKQQCMEVISTFQAQFFHLLMGVSFGKFRL